MTEAQLLPVVWTLASMTAAVLAILFVGPAQLDRLRATPGGRLFEPLLRLVYFLGVPYAALLTGSIATIDMGLTGIGGSILGWSPAEWLRGLSTALMLGVIFLAPCFVPAAEERGQAPQCQEHCLAAHIIHLEHGTRPSPQTELHLGQRIERVGVVL